MKAREVSREWVVALADGDEYRVHADLGSPGTYPKIRVKHKGKVEVSICIAQAGDERRDPDPLSSLSQAAQAFGDAFVEAAMFLGGVPMMIDKRIEEEP